MKRADYYRLAGDKTSEGMLQKCERDLRHRFDLAHDEEIDAAIVLGTGWGDAFPFEATHTVRLTEIGAFSKLDELEGHERRLELGTVEVDGKPKRVIVLRGRIHMNEDTFNPDVRLMVRLQIEVLIKLGVKKFVLTCAAGALWGHLSMGDLFYITDFVSWGSDTMPLFPGEFVNPAACIDQDATRHFQPDGALRERDELNMGPYVMFRGPHFESIGDKRLMLNSGGAVVGMSVKPECSVAALYPDVKVIPVALITNDNKETPDHETHRDRAKEVAEKLSRALMLLVR